jgi:hypothetical protein
MLRRACDGRIRFLRQVFDGALALSEQSDQFDAMRICQRFADAGELLIELILEGAMDLTVYGAPNFIGQ